MAQTVSLLLSAEDRAGLRGLIEDRRRPMKHVQRAQIVLLSADRLPVLEIAKRVGISRPMVWRWQQRFAEEGLDGLLRDKTRPPGTPPVPQAKVHAVVERTLREPPGAVTHWTGRAMASAMGLSLRTVQRIWAAHKLQPHRIRTFKRSTDPDFAARLDDVVGLYMNPPRHAVVFSIDEKSQIQALDRTQPGLPLKRGKCATLTHDYKRNGTTTLFAALSVLEGKVIGRCVSRHRHQEFIRFIATIERRPGRQGDPRHSRQLRRTQTPRGAGLARRSSAMDVPLHANLMLMAQRRRGLLLQAHSAELETRHFPLRR
jgi:transposase